MTEHVLFVTGRLARSRLEKVLAGLDPPPFAWRVADIGVKVAALMTQAILTRRLDRELAGAADRVVLPGRCRADLARLSAEFGTPFERGPDEVRDIPAWLGRKAKAGLPADTGSRLFAEIVDASTLPVEAILARAVRMRAAGADVIDIGCLPDTPFPHLAETVKALKARGLAVSVDSADPAELREGALAGADFLLSLTEHTLDVAAGTTAVPVLIPAEHGDLDSLMRAAELARRRGMAVILDPILDPIHFGFTASLLRYAETRRRLPDAAMLMGTGNLTELTEADSAGVTAMLMGVCSELAIANVLVVQVSPHTRRTVEEHVAAARLMLAARRDGGLPKGYGAGLARLHDMAPLTTTPDEIATLAGDVRDANFRIEVAADGIHAYNRDGHHVGTQALALFPKLGVGTDAAHAFYLGAELMKAEIAWTLGKRYAQDAPLDWGVGADRPAEDLTRLAEAGHTLRAKAAHAEGTADADDP